MPFSPRRENQLSYRCAAPSSPCVHSTIFRYPACRANRTHSSTSREPLPNPRAEGSTIYVLVMYILEGIRMAAEKSVIRGSWLVPVGWKGVTRRGAGQDRGSGTSCGQVTADRSGSRLCHQI